MPASTEVVKNQDLVAIPYKQIRQVRADEARPPGYQQSHPDTLADPKDAQRMKTLDSSPIRHRVGSQFRYDRLHTRSHQIDSISGRSNSRPKHDPDGL